MWPPPTISDYYRNAIKSLEAEIEKTPDDRVIGMNPEEWVDYLVRKYGMVPIVLDESRQEGMSELQSERVQRGYNIYDDSGPGTVVRSTAVRVDVPVVATDTLDAIWHHRLAPNTFSM